MTEYSLIVNPETWMSVLWRSLQSIFFRSIPRKKRIVHCKKMFPPVVTIFILFPISFIFLKCVIKTHSHKSYFCRKYFLQVKRIRSTLPDPAAKLMTEIILTPPPHPAV